MKGCRSSVLLFLFWTLTVVCSLVPLRANTQQIIEEGFFTDAMRFIAFFVYFSLQLTQLILSCFSDQRPSTDTHTYKKNPCPVEDASFLSKMLFWWFGGLVIRGYRTPLQAEDLWCLREEDSSDCIIADLEKDWARECSKLQQKECSLSGCRPTGPKLTV
eukprot:XP_014040740.1 PREDICTED: multidrug resistance-associated protein 1-like [Salmo salar]